MSHHRSRRSLVHKLISCTKTLIYYCNYKTKNTKNKDRNRCLSVSALKLCDAEKENTEGYLKSMDLKRLSWVFFVLAVISLVCYPASVTAGDIVHDDDLAPKKPGCENDFVLVL